MNNIFVEFLPPWVETGLQPAFYDKESGTVLQQTARMYARVNMLIRMFNKLSKNVSEYIDKFNELHDYCMDYFENLDVQKEINDKLDQMAESGELKNVFQIYLSEEFTAINERINAEFDRQNTLIEESLENTKSGSPIPVDSVSRMTDTSRIYVNTTDGNWYYYNGTQWTVGGVYQSTGIAPNTIDGFDLNKYAKTDVFETITEADVTYGNFGYYQGHYDFVNDSITTTQYLLFDRGDLITIKLPDDYHMRVIQYDRETREYITQSPMTTSYTIPAKNLYLIQISGRDGSLPAVSNISNIIEFKTVKEKRVLPVKQTDLAFVDSFEIPAIDLEPGNIDASGLYPQINRFRTKNFIPVQKGSIYTMNCEFGVYYNIKMYDKNFTYLGDLFPGWKDVAEERTQNITWDGYLKAVFRERGGTLTEERIANFGNNVKIYDSLAKSIGVEEGVDIDLDNVYLPNSNIYETSAHRGQFGNQYPENTILAFKVACNNKFDTLEVDIRFTSDGIPVVIHDATINRTARYSDGTTIESQINVADHTLTYLNEFDYGIYKGNQYAGLKMPTFEEMCIFTKFYDVRMNLDIKVGEPSQIAEIIRLVKKYGLTRRVRFTVGSKAIVEMVLNVLPKARVFIGAWTPTMNTVNTVKQLVDTYPDAEIGIDCYVGNTTDEIFQAIQDNDLHYSAYCENNQHIIKAVLNGAEDLVINNTIPYIMLKDYYDNNY